jgi:hypothetical protein
MVKEEGRIKKEEEVMDLEPAPLEERRGRKAFSSLLLLPS